LILGSTASPKNSSCKESFQCNVLIDFIEQFGTIETATAWAFRRQATCFKGMLTKAQLDDDVLPKIKLIWKLLGKG